MAWVNQKYKFVFIHIFKCGGSSMRDVLIQNFGKLDKIGDKHGSIRTYRQLCIAKNKLQMYENMLKFGMVRNPYDWMVSHYSHMQGYTANVDHKIVRGQTFPQFLRWYIAKVKQGSHYRRQVDFICDSNHKIMVDRVLRFEQFESELRSLLVEIGLNKSIAKLVGIPRAMKSKKRFKDIKDFYDESDIKLVRDFFAEDFEVFGYRKQISG